MMRFESTRKRMNINRKYTKETNYNRALLPKVSLGKKHPTYFHIRFVALCQGSEVGDVKILPVFDQQEGESKDAKHADVKS